MPRRCGFPTTAPRLEPVERIFQGEPVVDVERKHAFPGGEMWLGSRFVPIKSEAGEVTGALGISRNITLNKKDEALLGEAMSQLERGILQRTQELQAANQHLRLQILYQAWSIYLLLGVYCPGRLSLQLLP